jgi:hypothetical protein
MIIIDAVAMMVGPLSSSRKVDVPMAVHQRIKERLPEPATRALKKRAIRTIVRWNDS